MATHQKFKLLATQCAVASSPTRSPVIHLRRRKTLRMLLGRGGGGRRIPPHGDDLADRRERDIGASPEKRKELGVRHKLKDLFVSSPPPIGERDSEKLLRDGGDGGFGGSGGGFFGRRGSPRSSFG